MGSRFIIGVLSGSGTGNHLGPGTLVISSSVEFASGSQTSASRFFSRQITGSIHTVDGRTPLFKDGLGTAVEYDGGTGQWTTDIEDTAVTPGSYSRATITVDQQGRITAASANSGGGGGSGGGDDVGWRSQAAGNILTSGSLGVGGFWDDDPGIFSAPAATLHVSQSTSGGSSLPGLLVQRPLDGNYENFMPLVVFTSGSSLNPQAPMHEIFTVTQDGKVVIGAGGLPVGPPDATLTVSASRPQSDEQARIPSTILKIRGAQSAPDHDVNQYFAISSGTWGPNNTGNDFSVLVVSGAMFGDGPSLHLDMKTYANDHVRIQQGMKIQTWPLKEQAIGFYSGSFADGVNTVNRLDFSLESVGQMSNRLSALFIQSGSDSGGGGGQDAQIAEQGIFPDAVQSVVVNPMKADLDFKVFGGGHQVPQFLAIGVDGPRGKLVLMSGSQSSGLTRESYDDRSLGLIVSGAVTSMGAGAAGGNFNSQGFSSPGALMQGDLFLSGAIAGKFSVNGKYRDLDDQFGPGGGDQILGLAGNHVGILDSSGQIRSDNTGTGLFGSNTRFMVTGSHVAPSGSVSAQSMLIFPKKYNPQGPEDDRNFSQSGISLFHGDVFSSGSLYSFGGELRLGRPSDGRTKFGVSSGDGGAELPYGVSSYQVGMMQVNSLEVNKDELDTGDAITIDEVTFNANAQHTAASEVVKYLISLRDKDNNARHVYDGLLTGIHVQATGVTEASFTYVRNDVSAVANEDTPAWRAMDALSLTAVVGTHGDVKLQVTNTSGADAMQSNLVVRILKQMLTV